MDLLQFSTIGIPMAVALFGAPTEIRTERPMVNPAVVSTSDYYTSAVPQYETDVLRQRLLAKFEPAKAKIAAVVNEILGQKTEDEELSKTRFAVFSLGISLMAFNEDFTAVTASTNEDGDIIIARVNGDKQRKDFLRISLEAEEREFYLTYSRYEGRRSISNKYDKWPVILKEFMPDVVG
ncbi:hypothetical protein FUA23_11315 [Neolewinella aurantiaca]|uniref:Uncharacterized protein n=1 Tax=Neolewinella aurantiaca TaxID=2602767 RepID=A0A5C7FG76_9BACT|nr:hypothetical protein [Neolewinella aurantiaca]TXF89326.1 hypothetical protein FUA23_11315 [Neolewinella aurantiaca]